MTGVLGSSQFSWISPRKERSITVYGDKGMLVGNLIDQEVWFYENGDVGIDYSDNYYQNVIWGRVSEGKVIKYPTRRRSRCAASSPSSAGWSAGAADGTTRCTAARRWGTRRRCSNRPERPDRPVRRERKRAHGARNGAGAPAGEGRGQRQDLELGAGPGRRGDRREDDPLQGRVRRLRGEDREERQDPEQRLRVPRRDDRGRGVRRAARLLHERQAAARHQSRRHPEGRRRTGPYPRPSCIRTALPSARTPRSCRRDRRPLRHGRRGRRGHPRRARPRPRGRLPGAGRRRRVCACGEKLAAREHALCVRCDPAASTVRTAGTSKNTNASSSSAWGTSASRRAAVRRRARLPGHRHPAAQRAQRVEDRPAEPGGSPFPDNEPGIAELIRGWRWRRKPSGSRTRSRIAADADAVLIDVQTPVETRPRAALRIAAGGRRPRSGRCRSGDPRLRGEHRRARARRRTWSKPILEESFGPAGGEGFPPLLQLRAGHGRPPAAQHPQLPPHRGRPDPGLRRAGAPSSTGTS